MSDIVIKQGATLEVKVTAHAVLNSKNQSITYTDGTILEQTLPVGSVIDLTDYSEIKFVVWDSNDVLESGVVNPIITKTIDNGIDITDITAGEFVLILTHAETNAIPLKASTYSCEFSFKLII